MKIVKRIGQGGFGNVDHVILENGQHCARKTFAENQPLSLELLENVKKRFSKEVRTQSAINHPNIVPVLESDLFADPPYYFMPIATSTLDQDLEDDRTLKGNFIGALNDIVAGLEELHSMGIFHRDLKPHNVLRFDNEKGYPTYAISDFGLISMKESNLSELTKSGMGKGSDFYTAPEIAQDLRKASRQSDVYSLGCILHDMIGSEARVPFREIREDSDFGPILAGCTKDDPSKRFPSAKSVLDAVASIEFEAPTNISSGASDYAEALTETASPEPGFWDELANFLDKCVDKHDIRAIFVKLTADKIKILCDTNDEAAKIISLRFTEWVNDSSFNFNHCDVIANRVLVFYEHGDLETKAECLLALLEMGVSHNRFYVERKFYRLCGEDMDDNLAKRLVVQFHVIGTDEIYNKINTLERTINASRDELHPRIVKALEDMCA